MYKRLGHLVSVLVTLSLSPTVAVSSGVRNGPTVVYFLSWVEYQAQLILHMKLLNSRLSYIKPQEQRLRMNVLIQRITKNALSVSLSSLMTWTKP